MFWIRFVFSSASQLHGTEGSMALDLALLNTITGATAATRFTFLYGAWLSASAYALATIAGAVAWRAEFKSDPRQGIGDAV